MVNRHSIDDLSSYLDNQLQAARKEKVESHLRECQMCREELEKLKTVSEKLKVWQPSEPDADFHRALARVPLPAVPLTATHGGTGWAMPSN